MIEGLAACFAGLTDPRETSRCDHRLVDILAIAVCAVVACAESWEDIALYGRSKRAWLETFLELPNGIPSHDTFRRVFMLIDPDAFEACFARWAQSLAGEVEREVVAGDGKTLRRSGSRRQERGPLHLVSAWASERGLALGQRAVDGKSNEITAIPELLDTLRLEGCIVTLDAMGDPGQGRRLPPGAQGQPRPRLRGGTRALRAHLLRPRVRRPAGVRRLRGGPRPPGPPARLPGPGGKGSRTLERLARPPRRAGGGDDPQHRRDLRGRGRDPLLPDQPRGRSRRPGAGDPAALERGERAALGPGRHLPRGRQPGAGPHRRPQPRPAAQDRPRPGGQGPRQPGQPTRPAQEGRLERRLHAPAHRRPRSCVNPGDPGRRRPSARPPSAAPVPSWRPPSDWPRGGPRGFSPPPPLGRHPAGTRG